MKFTIPGRLDGLNEYTSSNRTNRYKANNDKKINQMHVKYAIRKAKLSRVDKYCSKGSLVGVEGSLRTRSYDNAQGNRIYVTEVVCQRVQFLDTKKKDETQQQKVPQDNFYDTNFVLEDDDIDF